MAHTYASNFVHCIFSTKERQPLIPADRLAGLCAYFSGIATGEGFTLVLAGGTSNHVHLLIALSTKVSLATAVQKLKAGSSRWMGAKFCWQQGYGAFSVSPSQVPAVKAYIRNQERHHHKQSFEEEFTALLHSCGIEYDPQHVFG